jgi:hypothetical protein
MLNVHFTGIAITNCCPGIIVIIAGRVVPGGQAAAISDNENAPRSAI